MPFTSSGPTDWTKLAGFTDSICCEKDNPLSNCGTSGANDFIEITGASEPPVQDVFKASSLLTREQKLLEFEQVADGNRFCGRWFGIARPNTNIPTYTYRWNQTNR